MKRIYKYEVKGTLYCPSGAEVLCANVQNNRAYIWAIVDTNNAPETRTFNMFATGEKLPDDVELIYIDTVMFQKGLWVFHVFEVVGAES